MNNKTKRLMNKKTRATKLGEMPMSKGKKVAKA
jgi:hypothetical protein